MSVFSRYKKEIMDAAHNERIRTALGRAITSYRKNVDQALKRFPQTVDLSAEVRQIKQNAVQNLPALAEQA